VAYLFRQLSYLDVSVETDVRLEARSRFLCDEEKWLRESRTIALESVGLSL
jgi:hypothetical protein